MIGLSFSRMPSMEAFGTDYESVRKGWRHGITFNFYKVSFELIFNWWTDPKL